MRRKPLIGLAVVVVIATVFWMLAGAIGSSVMGAEEFAVWRERNFWPYFGIFAAAVVVAALPVLWFLGRRLEKVLKEQEESAAATRGIGRLAMKAVAGDVAATDYLFDLLENDPTPAIRYQAARGLAMVGRPAVDKELFRQVRYWHADDKLALITTLRRGNDMRMYGLMRLLAEDRNPQVARRARAALVHIMPKTARMDDYAEKIARPRDAKRAAAARKKAAARGESADSYPEVPTAPRERRPASAPGLAPEGAAGGAGDGDSMSPAARAARKAARAAAKPGSPAGRRAAKRARQAADAPPVRPLSAGKVGAGRPEEARRAASAAAARADGSTAARPAPRMRRPAAEGSAAGAKPARRPPAAPASSRPPAASASSRTPARPPADDSARRPANGGDRRQRASEVRDEASADD